jgi:hypothetical protein
MMRRCRKSLPAACLLLLGFLAPAFPVAEELLSLPEYPHSVLTRETGPLEVDYVLGLGALQKVGGRWRHKKFKDVSGLLQRRTWQVTEPYTAEEAYEWYKDQLPEAAEVLFECRGRSCGSSAQWADRVFSERLLYGHDERQRYGAFQVVEADATHVLVLYAIDRANRRHYVHLDLLRLLP